MSERFADRLRRLREDQGFSIAVLADEVGVSEGAIRQLETGNVKSPSFAIGLRIAHRLGVDPYYLATGEGSHVDERITVLERRLIKLEKQITSISTTRR